MFRYMTYFMLIFVFGVKQKPIFILFHVDIQLFQHHLLKKKGNLWSYLSIFAENQLAIYVWSKG